MQLFDTIEEAAIAGTKEALKLAARDRFEYGGAVLPAPGGKFTVSEIRTSKSDCAVELNFDKEGAVSYFHCHVGDEEGKGRLTEFFSPGDLRLTFHYNFACYLGSAVSGKIYRFDPRTEGADMIQAKVYASPCEKHGMHFHPVVLGREVAHVPQEVLCPTVPITNAA